MRRFFAMMRYSKMRLIAFIGLIFDIVIMLALCVFDIIQIIKISNNAVGISSAFIAINYVLLVMLILNLLAIVLTIVLRKIKERSNEFKQN